MTRGRRKDLTIPPSRALIQQRDYRARKAQYLSELEQRVRRAEEENNNLRIEVSELKRRLSQVSNGASTLSPEVINASAELLHHLKDASSSLSRFQHIAFNHPPLSTDLQLATSTKPPSQTNCIGNHAHPTPSHNLPPPPSSTLPPSPPANRLLPPSSAYPTPPSIAPPLASLPPPPDVPTTRVRSTTNSPSVSASRPNTGVSRTGGSSDLAPIQAHPSGASPPALRRGESLPHLRPSPQEASPLLPPPPPPRRQASTPTHPFTLPPLRLPSPGEDTYVHRSTSIRGYHRSHPYPQPCDAYTSTSRLTPTTWDEIYRPQNRARSSLPSHSDESDEEEMEEDLPEQYDRDFKSRLNNRYPYRRERREGWTHPPTPSSCGSQTRTSNHRPSVSDDG